MEYVFLGIVAFVFLSGAFLLVCGRKQWVHRLSLFGSSGRGLRDGGVCSGTPIDAWRFVAFCLVDFRIYFEKCFYVEKPLKKKRLNVTFIVDCIDMSLRKSHAFSIVSKF